MKLLKPAWVSHGPQSKDNTNERPIYCLDIHPDGSRLATGGVIDTCGVVILWNMTPIRNTTLESDSNVPRKLFQMDNHQACVNCVRWSPSGRWLASAGMDKVIMLWSKVATSSCQTTTVFGSKELTKFTEHWRCTCILRGHHGDIIDLAWSHDGVRLASASVDNTVMVWSRQVSQQQQPGNSLVPGQFALLTTLRGHKGFVKGVAWDPVGRYLATQGDDVALRVWRTSDWQEEAVVRKPFPKGIGQSQVMRISWSLDGSTIVAPHSINNTFPTAKLVARTNWLPTLDLVGHQKHVICTRYNPNILRRISNGQSQDVVYLAIGSKDRSVSVWDSTTRRARLVVHDLFTNSVSDLTWNANGLELMASSLDGTICYMGFTAKELGSPWSVAEIIQLHQKTFGQSLLEKLRASDAWQTNGLPMVGGDPLKLSSVVGQAGVLIETPEALLLQQSQAELCQRLSNNGQRHTGALTSSSVDRPLVKGPSKQIETRCKDGRRRIIPKFLGHLDNMDEETNSNPQFTVPGKSTCGYPRPGDEAKPNGDAVKSGVSTPPPPPPTNGQSSHQFDLSAHTPNRPAASTLSPNGPTTASKRSPVQNAQANRVRTPEHSLSSSPSEGTATALTSGCTGTTAIGDDAQQLNKRCRVDLVDLADAEIGRNCGRLSNDTGEHTKRKRRRIRLFTRDTSPPTPEKAAATRLEAGDKTVGAANKAKAANGGGDGEQASDTAGVHGGVPSLQPVVTGPDQLNGQSKVQFVCSHPVDGPIIMELLLPPLPSSSTVTVNACRLVASRNDRRLWELVGSKHRWSAYAYNDQVICVGDRGGRIHLVYSNGGHLCPPLLLSSGVHLLTLTALPNRSQVAPNKAALGTLGATGSSLSAPPPPPAMSRLHSVVTGGGQVLPCANKLNGSSSGGSAGLPSACRLAVLCQSGQLYLWRLQLQQLSPSPSAAGDSPATADGTGRQPACSSLFLPTVFPELILETSVRDVLQVPGSSSSAGGGFLSLTFTPDDRPVVHRTDGSSFFFHQGARCWLELFDATDSARHLEAMSAAAAAPSGPLAACQQLTKLTSHQQQQSGTPRPDRSLSTTSQRINFLETQTHNAKLFGSAMEYRFWFTRWFRLLVEAGEEERIRQICENLIGPVVIGPRTSWDPTVRGIAKRDLVKELLPLFALNLRLQRLFVEMKELLEQCQQDSTSPLV